MLDIKFVCNNPDVVKQNIKNKFQDEKLPLVDEVIDLYQKSLKAKQESEALRANRNKLSKQIGVLMGQAKQDPSKKEEAEAVKAQVSAQAEEMKRLTAEAAELTEKVNSLYGQIMGNEGMVAYNEAKRECENLVNYIDAIINTAMNGGDPMTVQEPSASCTGSCSTCGGCH